MSAAIEPYRQIMAARLVYTDGNGRAGAAGYNRRKKSHSTNRAIRLGDCPSGAGGRCRFGACGGLGFGAVP